MTAAALIQLLALGISTYSQILADLHSGSITPAEAEARIAAAHSTFATDRTQEDKDFAAAYPETKPAG